MMTIATRLGVVSSTGADNLTDAEAIQGVIKVVTDQATSWAEQVEVVKLLEGPVSI